MNLEKLKTCKNTGCGKKFRQLSSLQNCCGPKCYDEYKKFRDGEKEKSLKKIGQIFGPGHKPKFPKVAEPIVSMGTWGTEHESLPKPKKPIARYSKTNKNERRKLPKETVEEVHERDGYRCVCCPSKELDAPHHAWYGGEAEHGPERNHKSRLVSICRNCHGGIHDRGDTKKREFCKEYLHNKHPECFSTTLKP